ncbi:karyopherin kap95 [Ceraceosorus bombacis]|uniref:Importin-95 n=1 Tax=Ceraceosorus bombacis TaxID=401625 RepID=A0A0P1BA95_9BASI|nr:karyopherin kap95 [Ceraceosorus bombacis]
MNAAELLQNTLSPDAGVRQNAEHQLEAAARDNYGAYVGMLAAELANESTAPHLRNAAGLAVKNALTARDAARQEEFANRWTSLPEDARSDVKAKTFSTLSSQDGRAGYSAAQVIAAIAGIEIPRGLWNELIGQLTKAMGETANNLLRQAALQTIGLTCEVISSSSNPEVLAAQSNEILTAVVQGARKEEPSVEVQLAAIQALYNSLAFVKANFEREGERNYIMQVICEATQHSDIRIKVNAFECLVEIMHLYYDKMRYYMEQALFGLTVLGMRDPEPRVAMQAIEFWATVAEEELDLIMEADEAREFGEEPERPCHGFARIALPEILPVLLETLRNQEEDAVDDDWTVAKAASAAVQGLSDATTDEIVALVIPFIEQNIQSPEWNSRDAAVMCFGCIMSGPSLASLAPLVKQALPQIVQMLHDPSESVKDTASWTLGRITDLGCGAIDLDNQLSILVQALVQGLQGEPRVATNCAWALMNLCDQLGGAAKLTPEGNPAPTAVISPFFEGIIGTLLAASDRSSNEANARSSAYEALSTAVTGCAQDTLPHVNNVAVTILDRQGKLNAMASQLVGMDDRTSWAELQTNLCSVLQALTRRLGKDILPLGDQIMGSLLTTVQACGSQSEALEDVFMAIGAFATASEAAFEKYLPSFNPFLISALQGHQDLQLCKTAIGIVGDVCRALGPASAQYAEPYMVALTENVQSQSLARDVKPVILSTFGDIALATGSGFAPFLPNTMMTLAQAAQSSVLPETPTDWAIVDFFTALKEAIADAYSGIVAGVVADSRSDLLQPYVESIVTFIASVAQSSQDRTETLLRSAIGLLGDVSAAYPGGELKTLLQQGWVAELIRAGRGKTMGHETRKVAAWAREQIRAASAGGS